MNKKGSFLILGGTLLLAAALLLTIYNLWDTRRAGVEAAAVVQSLGSRTAEGADTDGTPDYVHCPEMEMPGITLDGVRYIGILTIPDIGIELPVAGQWSDEMAKTAPCRYAGSAYLDTLVIAGHNYDTHFGRLKQLSLGAALSFRDADGNVFSYQVADIEVLPSDAVTEMTDSGWPLTLFTCTVGGQNRIAVRCSRQ